MLGQITDPLSLAPWELAAYGASFLGALFHLGFTKPLTCHSQVDILFQTRFSLITFECPVVKPVSISFLRPSLRQVSQFIDFPLEWHQTEWLKTCRLGSILPLHSDVKWLRPLNSWGRDFLKSDTNTVSPPVDYKTQSKTVGISRPTRWWRSSNVPAGMEPGG